VAKPCHAFVEALRRTHLIQIFLDPLGRLINPALHQSGKMEKPAAGGAAGFRIIEQRLGGGAPLFCQVPHGRSVGAWNTKLGGRRCIASLTPIYPSQRYQ